ncbi:MAG: HxsD-like protein [Candidatus Diapherotrites archaeon]|nr:HxsD-like protein [Candidatus Diapherotrites archaeon]
MKEIEIDENNKKATISFTKKIYFIEAVIKTINNFREFCDVTLAETDDSIQITIEPKSNTLPLTEIANEFCNHVLNESKNTYDDSQKVI